MKNSTGDTIQETKDQAENAYQSVKHKAEDAYKQVRDTASDVYEEGKKKASAVYEDGKKKAAQAQDCVQDYSKEVVNTVKDRPFTSLLVAGGIGFVLSMLLSK